MSERNIRDRAVANVEAKLADYVNDSVIFDVIVFPYPNQEGAMMFGIILGLFMPTPLLGSGEHFYVSQQWMEALMLDNPDNVQKIIFTMMQVLHGQKAEWLRGNTP